MDRPSLPYPFHPPDGKHLKAPMEGVMLSPVDIQTLLAQAKVDFQAADFARACSAYAEILENL